MNRGW